MIRHMVAAGIEMFPELPICLHQDHGSSVDICQSAIVNGYSSVMMDGSLEADGKTPSSFEYNVNVTKEVVARAHAVGASVEGELGVIGSLETGKGDKEDGHGAEGVIDKNVWLPTRTRQPALLPKPSWMLWPLLSVLLTALINSPVNRMVKFWLLTSLKNSQKLPNTHMVMHGSSSVPQELQDLINAYGGAIPQTYGVPVEEIVRGIKSGVRKVNVDTDCRMAITGAIRKLFAENPKEFDPRKYLKPAIEEMQKVCEARYIAFGAAGHADKIKVVPMSVMAKRYAAGEI